MHIKTPMNPFMSMRLGAMIKGLVSNKFKIKAKKIPLVLLSLWIALLTYPCTVIESIYYRIKTRKNPVKEPIFIIGHWRGGTTLLQNLLSKDPNKTYISPKMGYSYNTSLQKLLFIEGKTAPLFEEALGLSRIMDNMEYHLDLPMEDYLFFSMAYANSTWSMNFYPQARDKYFEYAFIDEFSQRKRKSWEKSYDKMIRKFYYQGGNKPLILKSPDATARMGALKEIYKDAKIINIYRNPYEVIRSTINLYEKMFNFFVLQDAPTKEEIEDFVFKGFVKIYNKYFCDYEKIHKDDIIELKFEDFEKDPISELKKIYQKYNWDFDSAKEPIQKYWNSLNGYKKNKFSYSQKLIDRVNNELTFYFNKYGYIKCKNENEIFNRKYLSE